MVPALEELIERWRADPRPSVTIQLCQAIADRCATAAANEQEHAAAVEIGQAAAARYATDVSVLLAVGRMYLALGDLAEAHVVIVQAAKLHPDDARAFKLLGELMLRRGDARRSARAFERAIEAGIVDAQTRLWYEHASRLVPVQDESGPAAVSEEVEQILPSLVQPALPFERVPLEKSEPPPAASTPWYAETLLGTGKEKSKRVRQQTLLGLAAANTPGRHTMPSDEDDSEDGGPTKLMMHARVRPERQPSEPGRASDVDVELDAAVEDAEAGAEAIEAEAQGDEGVRIADEDSFAKTLVRKDPEAVAAVQRHLERMQQPPNPNEPTPEPIAALAAALAQAVPAPPRAAFEGVPQPSPGQAAGGHARDDSIVSITDEAEIVEVTETERRPPDIGPGSPAASGAAFAARTPAPTGARVPDTGETRVEGRARAPEPSARGPRARDLPNLGTTSDELQLEQTKPMPRNLRIPPAVPAPPRRTPPAAPVGMPAGSEPPLPSFASSPSLDAPLPSFASSPSLDAPLPSFASSPPSDENLPGFASSPSIDEPLPKWPLQLPQTPASPPASARAPAPALGAPRRDAPAAAGASSRPPRMSRSELIDEFAYRPSPAPVPPSAAGFTTPSAPPRSSVPAWNPKPRKRGGVLVWFTVAVLALGLGGAGAYLLQQHHGHDTQSAKQIILQADDALRTGGSAGLRTAEQLLRQAEGLDRSSRDVALENLRLLAMRTLDDKPGGAGLAEAIATARARGAAEGEVAFASVLAASEAKNTGAVDELVHKFDADGARGADAWYQLAVGAAFDARGDAHAVDRFDAAVRADGRLAAARLRAARAGVLYGDPKQAEARAKAYADAAGDTPEAKVLTALAKTVEHTGGSAAPRAPVDAANVADLPRPLRAIGWTLALDPNRAAQGLSAAIDDADTPAVAMFCAQAASKANDPAAAQQAIDRALALAPAYAPARVLSARMHLLAGELDKAEAATNGAEGPEAAAIRGIVAYENEDLPRVTAAATTAGEGTPAGAVLALARDRLRGAKPLTPKQLGALPSDALWGDLVGFDAALDAGDFKRARALIEHWPDAEKNPARALRVARLRRYEGKLDDARRLIAVALTTVSRAALIEKALIDAEGKDERKRAVGSLDPKLEPERAWLEVYLFARQGAGGLLGARKALTKAKNPPPDAPLSLRIVAALAIAEMADPVRVEYVIRPLLGTWGANPDVIRAGVGVGLTAPELLKRLGK